jgi:hypothetical protein
MNCQRPLCGPLAVHRLAGFTIQRSRLSHARAMAATADDGAGRDGPTRRILGSHDHTIQGCASAALARVQAAAGSQRWPEGSPMVKINIQCATIACDTPCAQAPERGRERREREAAPRGGRPRHTHTQHIQTSRAAPSDQEPRVLRPPPPPAAPRQEQERSELERQKRHGGGGASAEPKSQPPISIVNPPPPPAAPRQEQERSELERQKRHGHGGGGQAQSQNRNRQLVSSINRI